MAKKIKYIWVIAYINRKYIHRIENDLAKLSFQDIKVNIPMVKILNKKFKGEEHYEEIPLLLNYGFFRLPHNKVHNHEFMKEIKSKVTSIYSWVRVLGSKDNLMATCEEEAVKLVVEMGKKLSIYTGMDLNDPAKREYIRKQYEPHTNWEGRWVPGKIITLKGYPFDNINAQIVRFKFSKEEVDVLLSIPMGNSIISKPATISFANMFYNIYEDHLEDDNMREVYLEDIRNKSSDKNFIDKLMNNNDGQED